MQEVAALCDEIIIIAGERERGSLEPLLCLPVTRDQLIIGKILAACLIMSLSLFLSLCSFFVALKFVPLQQLGMTPNFGPVVVLIGFFVLLPYTLLGAALMTLVGSFTKSYKEAQTWLSVVLLAPTLPILVVSILMIRSSTALMFIPSLSQHLRSILIRPGRNQNRLPGNRQTCECCRRSQLTDRGRKHRPRH